MVETSETKRNPVTFDILKIAKSHVSGLSIEVKLEDKVSEKATYKLKNQIYQATIMGLTQGIAMYLEMVRSPLKITRKLIKDKIKKEISDFNNRNKGTFMYDLNIVKKDNNFISRQIEVILSKSFANITSKGIIHFIIKNIYYGYIRAYIELSKTFKGWYVKDMLAYLNDMGNEVLEKRKANTLNYIEY